MWFMTAWLAAWGAPDDEAFDALVAGREGRALQVLRGALDDDEDGGLRCLLGEVALQVGRTREALDVLGDVPADAPCAGRAAFLQAEALRLSGDLDAAATRYGELTDALESPTSRPFAERLSAWGQRLLDEDEPDRDTAAALWSVALNLHPQGSQPRRALARRLAELRPSGASALRAAQELSEVVTEADARGDLAAADRRRLALLLGPHDGLALLAALPDDPATMAVRVGVAAPLGGAARHALAAALVAAHPDSDEARTVRHEVGLELADAGWVVEARAFLAPLADGDDEVAMDAGWALARLAARVGDDDAIAQLDALRERFPTARFRSELDALRADQVLAGLRADAAAGRFDATSWDRVATDAARALEAAWATPDLAERDDRLDGVIARWPRSQEAREALRHRALHHPEGLEWLRRRAGQGVVDDVLAELSEPEIGIRTTGEGAAEVELSVRGLEEVEMRLHRIDAEGWLRAGGEPGRLGELDVAIVAPDKTWSVSVPDGGPEVRFAVPIPVPGPGLYAVTAATSDREARTMLMVSDTRILARSQGPDLALVALRDGRPAGGARFWVRSGQHVEEVRAGGLRPARATLRGERAVVVAETPGGPAILEIGEGFPPAHASLRTAVDLDRPVYRPGDRVRFRAVATEGAQGAVRGTWRLSLVGPAGTVYQVVRAEADRFGAVQGELVVPWTSSGRRSHGASRYDLQLVALPPGQDEERLLAAVPVVDDLVVGRRIELRPSDEELRVVVFDEHGVPQAEQSLQISVDDGSPEVRRTDARGQVVLPAPPVGLGWSVAASLPDGSGRRSWVRSPPEAPTLRVRLDEPTVAPGEAVPVSIETDGAAQLRVVRRREGVEHEAPVAAPARFEVPTLTVYEHPTSRRVDGVRHTVRTVAVDGSGPVVLEGLEEGEYDIELVRVDGRAVVTAPLTVRSGTRLRLDAPPRVGEALRFEVDGGWSLVTVEAGRMLDAQLVAPGRPRAIDVDRRWHGPVRVVATGAEDAHQRELEVDATLQVTVDADVADEGAWQVAGRVTDAAGNGLVAQVVVRAVDELLVDEMGAPETLSTSLLSRGQRWSAMSARGVELTHGGWAVPLAAELLAEAAREQEARRRQLASEGRLGESRVAEVLAREVPLGMAGMAAAGSGYGGGGGAFGGRGRGRVGVARGDAVVLGSEGYSLFGDRGEGLWEVVQTDRDGRFELAVQGLDGRRRWRVDAVAVVGGSIGTAQATVAPSSAPFAVAAALLPGMPSDEARPVVHVVNPGEASVDAQVRVGGVEAVRTVSPGEAWSVAAEPLPAGDVRAVEVRVGGRVVHRSSLDFPLAEGLGRSDDAHETLHVAVRGAVGGTVAGALAFMDDPVDLARPARADETDRAVSAARSALAAWPVLSEPERAEAMRRVWAGVAVARDRMSDLGPREGAQALLLVADAAPRLDLPRSVVTEVADALQVEPQSPLERLDVAFARAVAGVEVQEATIGRLQRDVERLDDDGRGRLRRLLDHLGVRADVPLEPPDAPSVQWGLAGAVRWGPETLASVPPPPMGHVDRADWVQLAATVLGRTAGTDAEGPGWSRRREADPTAAVSWVERVPTETTELAAQRWPAGTSGRPAEVRSPSRWSDAQDAARCGAVTSPCRVVVGDAVAPIRTVPGVGGLRPDVSRQLLVATTPGRYELRRRVDGQVQAVHVEVLRGADDLTPLGQGETLAVAQGRRRIEQPFADLLVARPSLEDWAPTHRAEAARLRFAAADPDDVAGTIAAFEDLRDEVPTASIDRADVVRTARAYHRAGQAERAIRVYQQAIGSRFLEDAADVADVGGLVGPLAGLQALREVTLRYPAVPVVRQSEFALPDRLLALVGQLPPEARERGVTDTEVQLMAAAWDRRFVALSGDSPLAPEAGLRLATGLMDLDATERALQWVQRLRRDHPTHELTDRWMLLEALLLTELGRGSGAAGLLQQLSEEEVPLGGGERGPSVLRDDARLAWARLAESQQDYDAAATRYQLVESTFPEARLSAMALTDVALSLDETVVRRTVGEGARLRVTARNVDRVDIRAYKIDLRTVFLRDGGLPFPHEVRVDGLRPDLAVSRPLPTSPFPQTRWVDLPLQGPGAWLVRLDADGASALAWVLRSDLAIHHTDGEGQRRLSVQLRGAPAADARVRALGAGGIVATSTDVRGVAQVGYGAAALVEWGPHVALTTDLLPGAGQVGAAGAPPQPAAPSLLDRVRGREAERRSKRRSQYDYIGTEASGAVEASRL